MISEQILLRRIALFLTRI